MGPIIEVQGLSKSYGRKRGITDVSFAVSPGEVFGFLGPNGAGKTTTIRTLMALLRADSGSARIAGLDCWSQSLEIKKLVGYVPGEPSLDPNLTGGQILEYFANLRGGVDQSYLRLTAGTVARGLDADIQQDLRRRLVELPGEVAEGYVGRRVLGDVVEIAFVSTWSSAKDRESLEEPIWPQISTRYDTFRIEVFDIVLSGTPASS